MKLKNILRAEQWWGHILPPILLFFYLGLFQQTTYSKHVIYNLLFLMLLSIMTGFAGYFINDLFDIQEDKKAGKKNYVAGFPLWLKITFIPLLIAVLLLAAKIFSAELYAWEYYAYAITFSINFLLFILYSAPPFRFKTSIFIAPAMDALYSGTVFYVLAYIITSQGKAGNLPCNSFMNELLNNTVLRFYLLLIFLWGFLKGLRNYLTHLADDYEHDSKSGLQTLAIKYDSSKIQVLANLLYPAEVFCLSVIVYKASGLNYIAVLPCLFFSGIWIWHILKNRAQKCETLNDLHEVWLPVLLITLLVSNNTAFYPLVIVHILLFSYHLYKIYCLLDLIYLHTLFKIIGPIRKKGK